MTFSGSWANSQNQYLNSANDQLRSMFSPLSFPSSNINFLYDRSAKLSDSVFYQNNSPGVLEQGMWLQLYSEMYYAAHDTFPLTTQYQIEKYSNDFSNDTIALGIMDYDWYYCAYNTLYDSIATSVFFDFDTTNNKIYDRSPRPHSPLKQSNIFAVSPLQESTNFTTPTFRIDPSLFFSDVNNSPYYSSLTFRIDFGDGTGWHYFDPNVVDHVTIDYDVMGEFEIIAELLGEKDDVLKKSKSKIKVVGKAKSNTADYTLDMPGINVGVYNGCGQEDEGKVIIYLEGIDILDMIKSQNRGIDEIYSGMIHSNYIEELRSFNYNFYVVDWKNSRTDIRFNALYLVNLIEKLKVQYKASDEQFVIIGESMGGLVARFAMTYMEHESYLSNSVNPFKVEQNNPGNLGYLLLHPNLFDVGSYNREESLVPLMHKTRELITFDTPHQGANVPMSIQLLYQKVVGNGIFGSNILTNAFNLGLGSYSAKQMLLNHIDGKIGVHPYSSEYEPAPQYNSFFSQLNSLGNYPQYAKLMALSSGALNGANQRKGGFGVLLQPNDMLFAVNEYKDYKIFGKTVPLYSLTTELRTNPLGTGNVLDLDFNIFIPKIKLKWFFKIVVTTIQVDLITEYKNMLNAKPYCVSAGGNLSYDILDEDVRFGFIPLQSGLDYGKGLGLSLNHNIQNENINTKLSRTPFDVFMGYLDGKNNHHLNYRDPAVYNITAINSSCLNSNEPIDNTYYDADANSVCGLRRGLLNLEIGDEEMYLENWTLNRTARFQAQYDVHVNERNPYYEYAGQNPMVNLVSGVYSKENDLDFTLTGLAKFDHGIGMSPTGIGFSYFNPTPIGTWSDEEVMMTLCLIDFSTKQPIVTQEAGELNIQSTKSKMLLIPNPTNGAEAVCEYAFLNHSEQQTFLLYDASGRIITEKQIYNSKNANVFQMNLENLQPGMYFVAVSNGYEKLIQKLIIK